MADQYDGSVRINTGLDTSGFESGSDKLMDALQRIETAINRLGDTATRTLETLTQTKISTPELPTEDQMRVPSPEMDTRDLDESTRRVQDDMSRTRDALRQPDNPEGPRMDTTNLDESTRRIQDDMRGAQEALDTELPAPAVAEMMPDSAAFDREAGRMQSALDRITREIDRMVNTSAQGFRSASAVLAFSDRLDDARVHIGNAREELRAFAEQQIPTDQYAATTQEIERAERALLRLYDRRDAMEDMGVSESSAQWERLSLQIQAAEEQVERYEADADRMRETGLAFVDPQATEQYRQLVAQLNEAEAAYQTNVGLIQQEQIEQERVNVLAAQEGVAAATTAEERQAAMQSLREAQAQLNAVASESVMPGPDEENLAVWEQIANAIMEAGRQSVDFIRTWGGRALHGATAALRGLVSGLKGVTTAAAKAASGIQKIDNTLKGFFTRSHKGKSTIDSLVSKLFGVKRMLMSRLKRTFISYLFSQITSAVKEMARFDVRFDQSISNLRNRTTELSANLVSGFTGLFRQIEPYITRLLEAASNGIIRLNAILASLRGETTIAVARQQTQSYAASLDDAADSTEAMRQAQLRLNRALTTYDELHKLGEDEQADIVLPEAPQQQQPLYEEIPVEAIFTGMDEAVQDAIDRLIAAVRSGDWYGAGAAVADGLNYIVQSIDDGINRIHDGAVGWAHNIAEALNGLVDGFDALALGRTIADALNLAVDVAYEFLTTFNFGRIGERIGDAITGFLTNINAEQLGRTIAAALNDAVSFAYGLITHTNFGMLGQRIGEAINGFFSEFDIEALGRLIAAKINAVFDFAYGLLTTVDFSRIGQQLVAGLNALTDNIDVQQIGRTFVTAINGILDLAYETITGYNWGRLGEQLGNFVNELFGGGYRISERSTREVGGAARDAYERAMESSTRGINWARVGQLISEGIVGVLDSITSFLETVDWYAVGQDIIELLRNIDWAAIARAMIEMLKGALGGLAGLIQGALGTDEYNGEGITYVMGGASIEQNGDTGQSLISTHIFDGLAQGMTNQYQQEFEEAGENIGNGIIAGFESVFRQAERKVKEAIFDPLVRGIKRAFDIASPAGKMKPYGRYIGDGVLDGIRERFERTTIAAWIGTNVRDPLIAGFTAAFSVTNNVARGVMHCGYAIAAGIKEGIETSWSLITTLLNNSIAGIQLLFLPAKFVQAGLNVIIGIGNGIGDENNFATNIRSRITRLAQQIENAFTGFVERGQQIVADLGIGISGNQTAVDTPSTTVSGRIKSAFAGFVDKGRQIIGDISGGISSNQTAVDTPSTTASGRIKSAFAGFVDKGRQIIGDIGTGLTDQGNWDSRVGRPVNERASWIRGAFTGFVEKGRQIISDIGGGLTDQGTWDSQIGGPVNTRAGWIRGAFDGFVQKGRDIISQLGGGIADLGNWNNTVGGTVLERVSWIVNGLRGGDYYNAGRYIVQGLDQGIQDEYSTSRRIAENLGGVVQDAFNRAMGIGSPSRVMAEAGGFVVAGLVQGIDGESQRVYQTMRTIADGIVQEADGIEIEPEINVATQGLDAVADKLAAIADIFGSIRDTLQGFPTLPVPAVAVGAIAPAQTRTDTLSTNSSIKEIKDMLARFIDRVTELEEKVANRPITLESTVTLDSYAVGKAISTHNQISDNISNGKGGAW